MPLVAQAHRDLAISFVIDEQGEGTHTINVTFTPDCGTSAVCPVAAAVPA